MISYFPICRDLLLRNTFISFEKCSLLKKRTDLISSNLRKKFKTFNIVKKISLMLTICQPKITILIFLKISNITNILNKLILQNQSLLRFKQMNSASLQKRKHAKRKSKKMMLKQDTSTIKKEHQIMKNKKSI